MKLKLLHIASDDLWGGAEAQIELLIRGLILTYSKDISCNLVTFNQGRLYNNLKQDCPAYLASEKTGFYELIKEAIKIGKLIQPDIIVSHGYKEGLVGFCLSIITKCRWIHQFHGSSEGYRGIKFFKAKIYNLFVRSLAKVFSSAIVVISKSTLNSLGLSHLNKAKVIYNAANKPEVTKTSDTNNVLKLFLIGRLAPVKRIDLAIEFFAKCIKNQLITAPLELHIVGDGSELNSCILKTKQQEIQEKVIFHGFNQKPFDFVCENNSILLLTSDSEGIPTVILEAMHLGIPILSRNVGGISEIKEKVKDYPLILINNNELELFPQFIANALNSINDLNMEASNCDTSFFKVERYINEHYQMYQTLA